MGINSTKKAVETVNIALFSDTLEASNLYNA